VCVCVYIIVCVCDKMRVCVCVCVSMRVVYVQCVVMWRLMNVRICSLGNSVSVSAVRAHARKQSKVYIYLAL